MTELYRPGHPVRFVTAASLFDGHDASINIMRRILQAQGAEVIHLGHNRSVDEVVDARASQEDAQGVAISSYQGGHVEYFKYLVDRLPSAGRGRRQGVRRRRRRDRARARSPSCSAYGVPRIFSPEDGQRLGPARHDQRAGRGCDVDLRRATRPTLDGRCCAGDHRERWPGSITALEAGQSAPALARTTARRRRGAGPSPCSASPAPAARASRRSPTSWSAASASTRRTSSASPSSPSTRRGARAAARCSATASA